LFNFLNNLIRPPCFDILYFENIVESNSTNSNIFKI